MGDGNYGARLIIVSLMLLLNAFFAVAEVALMGVSKARLQYLARQGHHSANAALTLLENPSRFLSVLQVGISLASLALGWAGGTLLAGVLRALWEAAGFARAVALENVVSTLLSFGVMVAAHVVFGGVLPKQIAFTKPVHLALLTAPPLLVFARVLAPLTVLVEVSVTALSRVLDLKARRLVGAHTPEELKFIIHTSTQEGELLPSEQQALQGVMELRDLSAREVMVPRNAVVMLPEDASLEAVLRIALEHRYSRYPVYRGRPDNVIGVIHIKDLLQTWEERRYASARKRQTRPFRLTFLLRKPHVVPETKPLLQLLDEFRQSHQQMGIVVDEFGTVSGIVTMEDALEQVFGNIEDEHDERRVAAAPETLALTVEGTISIRTLQTEYGITLPMDAGFETLAGFLLYELGRIPTENDAVEHQSRRYVVVAMDNNRIAQVRIEPVEPRSADDTPLAAMRASPGA